MTKPVTVTDTWVDKTRWGDGPWHNEPDRAEWIDPATGYPCLALREPDCGFWRGYVAVEPDHHFWGFNHAHVDIRAHGRLTFSGPCVDTCHPREQLCHTSTQTEHFWWWFGFDCGHAIDHSPGIMALLPENLREPLSQNKTYRTFNYVTAAITTLARDLGTCAGD